MDGALTPEIRDHKLSSYIVTHEFIPLLISLKLNPGGMIKLSNSAAVARLLHVLFVVVGCDRGGLDHWFWT